MTDRPPLAQNDQDAPRAGISIACYRCHQPVTPRGECACKDGICLICGDCREVLPWLEEGCVDLVLTDPPYGARRPSARRLAQERFAEVAGNGCVDAEWASSRYVRNKGAMYCFCTWDTLEQWRTGLTQAGFRVRSCVVWDKGIHGLADLRTCWAPRHELILFGAVGRHELAGKRPIDVLRVSRVPAAKLRHPYEKPVGLLRQMVLPSAPRGSLVLDPFAGSGTTGRACKDLGRRCLMIEIEPKYCRIAAERLKQGVLFV